MKVGLVGPAQSGKKTLFGLLTGNQIAPQAQPQAIPGQAVIRDPRFDRLVEMYKPKSEAPAVIDVELLPALDRKMLQEGKVFTDIASLDAICLVVRAFENEAVYHVHGSVDALRDAEELIGEFVLHDMLFVEKRLERIEQSMKKGKGDVFKAEKALLERFQPHLDAGLPLRTCEMSDEEKKLLASYPFLTLKQLVIAVNCGDDMIGDASLIENISQQYESHNVRVMQIAGTVEFEIQSLDSDEQKKEFMSDYGIEEPAVNLLSRHLMESLGLVSFFTVGEDEVKQWLVRSGATAPEAAGVIHSDIQRGFIRAEVMKYDDLISAGSEANLKSQGKFYIMGKDYIVLDGDSINFRFNV